MNTTYRTKQRVKYLEQEQWEEVHTAPMVLMKNKKTGKYLVVDAAGTVWNTKK